VSERLNPGATPAQIFMFPPDLDRRCAPILSQLATELRAEADSTDQKMYANFFYGQHERQDLPSRSGYYVGYRVAAQLAEGRTLPALARLHGDPLKAEVLAALARLAK
jgi:hypothetical protein